MNQQYDVRQPIEERSLVIYVFLIPAIMLVLSVLLYIFVIAAAVGVRTEYGYTESGMATMGGFAVFLTILFGMAAIAGVIYYAFIWTGVSRDINIMCEGDTQAAPLMSFAGAYLIGILVPFGIIFYLYYIYKMQDKMVRNAQRYGVALKWSSVAVLLFAIFINIVAFVLLIISFNEMARAYNASYGLRSPQDDGYGNVGYGNMGYDNAGGYLANEIAAPIQNALAGGAAQGTLVCTAGESAGASITMNNGDTVVLGRDPQISNVILRNDKKISRRHCTVSFRNGVFTVTDYSSNGTRLGNGQKIEQGKETPLGSQGVIRLSDQTEFKVQAN